MTATTDVGLADLRDRMAHLDMQIIELVRERIALSDEVRSIRLDAGDTRADLSAERTTFRTYRTKLGLHATGLARSLLVLCGGTL
ncbi:hypothetical protein [Lentzea sp. NPDC059081]|uniref:hypothetical protein n=1 Tax=Lentzea sp. NPDC059081 TaxID=3346719 RepID=UPI0036C2E704